MWIITLKQQIKMNLERFELRQDIILDDSPQRGEFGIEHRDKETVELYLTCHCGSEILKIESFTDAEEVYLSVFKYSPTNTSLFRRLSLAWDVLNGRKINTADIILSAGDFNKLRNFSNGR